MKDAHKIQLMLQVMIKLYQCTTIVAFLTTNECIVFIYGDLLLVRIACTSLHISFGLISYLSLPYDDNDIEIAPHFSDSSSLHL